MNNFICPLCQFNSGTIVRPYEAKTNLFKNRNIVKCNNCKLYSASPMLSDKELIAYYNEYWQEFDVGKRFPRFIAQAYARYDFIKPFLAIEGELNILDIGSGFGLIRNCFFKNNHNVNYDVIEVDNIAIDYLNHNIHPRYIYSNIEQCNEKYDLIIASHILEHYEDINPIMNLYGTKLVNDGLLFVEVPNKDYLFKKYDEPHVIFFSPETLGKLLKMSYFKILRIDTCGNPISALIDQPNSLGNIAKKIAKKIFSPFIQSKKHKSHKNMENYDYVNQYGGERQWIRLIAKKDLCASKTAIRKD